MPKYLPDTNVLIDFGRDPQMRDRLERVVTHGELFVVAPPALIELVRGLIRTGEKFFQNDRQVFRWLHTQKFTILDLPRVFMAEILHTTWKRSSVIPRHYEQLIAMIASAHDFADFVAQSKQEGSVWAEISSLYEIHNTQLDKEFESMGKLASKRGKRDHLAASLANTFGAPGCRPNRLIVHRKFSAAIEFLENSLDKVRGGANLRKNDPGLYVDFQLLLYLADPNINLLTKENFSRKIKDSQQRDRIIHPDRLPWPSAPRSSRVT